MTSRGHAVFELYQCIGMILVIHQMNGIFLRISVMSRVYIFSNMAVKQWWTGTIPAITSVLGRYCYSTTMFTELFYIKKNQSLCRKLPIEHSLPRVILEQI